MRHRKSGRKLGRTTAHRWAMFKNMAASLVDKERIETTLCNAKELRGFADHLITLGKKNSLQAKRQAFDFIRSGNLVSKLFSDLAPRFKDRSGGYTRVLKLGFRHGDSSPMAIIEYLPQKTKAAHEVPVKERKEKKKSKLKETPKKSTSKGTSKKPVVK